MSISIEQNAAKKEDILKLSKFFTSKNFVYKNYPIETISNIKSTNIVNDILKIYEYESDILYTKKINISNRHKLESFDILNSYLSVVEKTNIKEILVFAHRDLIDILLSFFKFYPKFNDINIEYILDDDTRIILYDSMPIKISSIEKILLASDPSSYQNYQSHKKHIYVDIGYIRCVHTAIKINVSNDQKKFNRKLKLKQLK